METDHDEALFTNHVTLLFHFAETFWTKKIAVENKYYGVM